MEADRISLRADATSVFDDHLAAYLAQLAAPMDDMWAAFAEQAAPHALLIGDEVVGSCCVDDEHRLLRFFVLPPWQHGSVELLRCVAAELDVAHVMVFTQDPNALSTALDVASKVEVHSLCFAPMLAPQVPELDGLVVGGLDDHARIVDFEVAAVGMPREFLDGYVRMRLEREELLLHEKEGELVAIGELRRDPHQAGVAQVGMMVAPAARGRGLATRMLASLMTRSREEGLTPICSTEVGNAGARRAIERAGFRANHRLLRVELDL